MLGSLDALGHRDCLVPSRWVSVELGIFYLFIYSLFRSVLAFRFLWLILMPNRILFQVVTVRPVAYIHRESASPKYVQFPLGTGLCDATQADGRKDDVGLARSLPGSGTLDDDQKRKKGRFCLLSSSSLF